MNAPDRILPPAELYERLGLQHLKAPGKAVQRLAARGLRLTRRGKGYSATDRDVSAFIAAERKACLNERCS